MSQSLAHIFGFFWILLDIWKVSQGSRIFLLYFWIFLDILKVSQSLAHIFGFFSGEIFQAEGERPEWFDGGGSARVL